MGDLVERVARKLSAFETGGDWRLFEAEAKAIIPIVLEEAAKRAETNWSTMCGTPATHVLRESYGKAVASAIRSLGEV